MKTEETALPLEQKTNPKNYFCKVIKSGHIYLINGVLVNENTKLCCQKLFILIKKQ